MASQGNTSTFAASSILDTTHKAFEYGRWATQNQFMLSGLSDTTLDAYDHAFTQFIDFRRVGELEKSNMLSAQCFELLGMWQYLYLLCSVKKLDKECYK